jgi:hypothetical protein
MALDHDAGAFEFEVGAGDGVGVDDELLGERADRGNLLAGREPGGRDEVFHLVDNLEVDGRAGRGIDMNLHGFRQCINTIIHKVKWHLSKAFS